MPSTSPGIAASANTSHPFDQILPGTPAASLQSLDTFVYRQRRYVAYISGSQLNVLVQPNLLVQVVTFSHELVALAADDQTGELLVAGTRDVWVLRPHTEGWTKVFWEKALNLQREDAGDKTHRVNWGNDGEALIGGSRVLSLFSTRPESRSSSSLGFRNDEDKVEKRQASWSKGVPSPLLFADFSPSASLIASCSHHDRLLKIWRRLSYEEGLFDHTYLPHAGSITLVQWRPRSESDEERSNGGSGNRHDDDAEILFTVANDALLRIWRTGVGHDADIMMPYATLDLVSSIPQSPDLLQKQRTTSSKPVRFLFILPSEQFCAAIRAAVGLLKSDTVDHATEHLNFMASQDPDVVVSFDGHGKMSAWGLQSIGHKRRPDTPSKPQAFYIAHAENLAFKISADAPAVFKPWIQDTRLHFLVHSIQKHGQIQWWEGDAKSIFSLSASSAERLRCKCTWQGHDTPVSDLRVSDRYLTSQSRRESKVWEVQKTGPVTFSSAYELGSEVNSIVGLDQRRCIAFEGSRVVLRGQDLEEIASASQTAYSKAVPYITSSKQTEVSGYLLHPEDGTVAQLTAQLSALTTSAPEAGIDIKRSFTTGVDVKPKFSALVPARDSRSNYVVACTSDGHLYRSKPLDEEVVVSGWQKISNTGIVDAIAFTADRGFAGLISALHPMDILITSLEDGYVEHRQAFDKPIQHIKGATLETSISLLAIAFHDSVQILIRGRYSAHQAPDSSWMAAKKISIEGVGLQINEIAWLPDATLVTAAGNGLFLSDSCVRADQLDLDIQQRIGVDDAGETNVKLQDVAYRLQDPLPVWHPEFLNYVIEFGKPALVATFLSTLARKLKFWSPGELLDLLPEASVADMLAEPIGAFDLGEDAVLDLKEQLEEKLLPQLSHSDQDRLRHILYALVFMKDHVSGLDRHALRYLYTWKLRLLEEQALSDGLPKDARSSIDHSNHPFVPVMSWKEIAFARQSATQQALLDFLVLHYDNKITWSTARDLGMVAWISDREALEKIFEQLAQTAYRSQQPADPVDASLYFLALHKKPTLLALWRIATWHKEQRSTMNFLKRDFAQAEARTAAKKNAYALMGKRRFEYSAAFFLLADDPASATSVLAGQCGDLALAIAVARLYSGDGSSVLRKLLEDRVIPQAKQDGNRWLLSWCHAVLFERQEAAQSLVMPLDVIKTWHQDEPGTLLLYRELKTESSEYEYAAILRAARLLRNMGLWLSALDLVRAWDFKTQRTLAKSYRRPSAATLANGDHQGAEDSPGKTATQTSQTTVLPSLLDDFSQPAKTQSGSADDKTAREAKAAELLKKLKEKKGGQQSSVKSSQTLSPTPTQFKEPDANSLLDSFGF